jgi:hypothetical protein
MSKAKQKDGAMTLEIPAEKGKSESRQMSEVVMRPMARNGFITGSLGSKHFAGTKPDLTDTVEIMVDACKKVRANDLSDQRDILTSQAMALDAIFTAMVLRSENNLKDYFDASQRFMRMAMKAQAQCRTTIEALDRLARGGEQVIKHVHVDNRGGQAVIADTVQTGGQNAEIKEQPHAISEQGIPDPQPVRSKDAKRETVPIAGDG